MDFLEQIENYTDAKKHRGCYKGFYGKVYNLNEDIVRPLGCNNWNCPNCRPRKKYNLFLETYYCVINLDLTRHFIMTFQGKKYRELYSWIESYYVMSKIWNKYKQVIEYHYGPLDYIQFPRSQQDGYCHLHTLIPKYIPWRFLEKKRRKLYPELGSVSINKNVDVATYLHRDFFKDNEYIIPNKFTHVRHSRSIKFNEFNKNDFNLIFSGNMSEGAINKFVVDKLDRLPLDVYINELNKKRQIKCI